jgi:hypothetical protein
MTGRGRGGRTFPDVRVGRFYFISAILGGLAYHLLLFVL